MNFDLCQTVLSYLRHCIDFAARENSQPLKILPNVDCRLDDLRSIYDSLETILHETGIEVVLQTPHNLKNLVNTAYIPQVGFLVSLQTNKETLQELPWELVFCTESTAYFKNDAVRLLDEKYGDIYGLVCGREIEIRHEIQTAILNEESSLIQAFQTLTELDCQVALAIVSLNNHFVRPKLLNGLELKIVKGRHPLVEKCVPSFVPNNTKLNQQAEKQIILLTGANYSGKSVYLNQVALIVILSQIGCYVPAEEVKIDLVDKILTRIKSRETSDKLHSTFAIDVNQISKCLLLGTERSLLIIDEFGKGSDMIDGSALFGSLLLYLNRLKETPRTLCSTHFHELFKCNFSLLGGKENIHKTIFHYMEVINNKSTNSNTITYLYQLNTGFSLNSFVWHTNRDC